MPSQVLPHPTRSGGVGRQGWRSHFRSRRPFTGAEGCPSRRRSRRDRRQPQRRQPQRPGAPGPAPEISNEVTARPAPPAIPNQPRPAGRTAAARGQRLRRNGAGPSIAYPRHRDLERPDLSGDAPPIVALRERHGRGQATVQLRRLRQGGAFEKRIYDRPVPRLRRLVSVHRGTA